MFRKYAKYALPIALALNCILFFIQSTGKLNPFPFVNNLQMSYFDGQLISHSYDKKDLNRNLDVVIVDIDEKSLRQLGRWPWDRTKIANVVDSLFGHYAIKALGFDVIFAESQGVDGLNALKLISEGIPESASRLERILPSLDNDAIFAKAIANRPVVLASSLYTAVNENETSKNQYPIIKACNPEFFPNLPIIDNYIGSSKTINKFARFEGNVMVSPDLDGKIRRVKQLAAYKYNDRLYCVESLSLALLRAATGASSAMPNTLSNYGSVESIKISLPSNINEPPKNLIIPVSDQYDTFIPYIGPERTFKYIPAVDVINKTANLKDLHNKIVLFGTTAVGLKDLRSTPVGSTFPGVEVHANMIQNTLDQTLLSKPGFNTAIVVVLTLVFSIASAIGLLRLKALSATIFCLLLLVITLAISEYAWTFNRSILPVAIPICALSINWVLAMTFGYFFETRTRKKMTDLFGQYVPPELVRMMSQNPDGYTMRGKKKELTVLFSDVRDFTSISENMKADQLADMIGAYLGEMTEICRKHNGTLDKYIGDALMAFWGAPVDDRYHAYNCVCAALTMQKKLNALNKAFEVKGWPKLKIGIGVNTGYMSVGDMGTSARRAYTVMGDAVNVGSRLETATKELLCPILVGTRTYELTKDYILYEDKGLINVKGKNEPIQVYMPIKVIKSPKVDDQLNKQKGFLAKYRK